jgi:ABC-type Mn2+/Zn2+ transport system permease subunit
MSIAESLTIYAPNIVAVLLSSAALSLVGGQLASRSESLQAFVASQSAALGITAGLAGMILLDGAIETDSLWPIFTALIAAVGVFLVGQRLSALYRSKSSEILISLFLLSLALNYLLTAALPQLESHFSSSFVGDIATASSTSSHWLSALSLGAGIFLFVFFKPISFQSFWMASGGVEFLLALRVVFYVVSALLVVESTRIFGFLYTSASLVIVPLVASLVAKGLYSFRTQVILISMLASGLGFLLSLYSSKFSTSATIVALQVLVGSVWIVFDCFFGGASEKRF